MPPSVGTDTPLFLPKYPLGRREMLKLNPEELQKGRWLKALEIAKVLFVSEGYFDDYLKQIEQFISEKKGGDNRFTL